MLGHKELNYINFKNIEMKTIEIDLVIKGTMFLRNYKSEIVPQKDDMIFISESELFIVEYRMLSVQNANKIVLVGHLK